MPDYTEHYSLKKPKQTENYDIDDVTRDNADLIDKALYEKVDKLPSKGLSTNDFTTPLLKKLNGIESGAQKNEEGTVIDNNYVHTDNNFTDAEKNKILELEQENNELSENMPWNTTSGKSLHITDSAKYSKNKLSISGDMEQEKRSGKNKFKIPASATSNGVTLTNNGDGSFTLNGTTTGIAIFNATLNNSLKAGTYTLSYKSSVALGNSFFLRVRDENMTLVNSAKPVSQVQGNGTSSVASYTTSVEAAIVAINLTQTGVTYNNVVIYAQLEEGTTATEFEQYGATPSTEFPSMPVVATGVQKIRQFGKNLISEWIENKLVNSTGGIDSNTSWNTSKPVMVESNNFITFYHKAKTGNQSLIIAEYDKNENFIKRNIQGALTTYTPYTIQTSSNTRYIRLCYDKTKNNTELMLEYNNVATGYEPYWEQIHTLNLGTTEICAIKDTNGNVVVKDRAVFRNGKWQWEKKIIKIALSSIANWQLQTNWSAVGDKTNAFYIAKPIEVASEKEVVCSHFKFVKDIWSHDVEGIYISSSLIIRLPKTVTPDVATLKTYLANNTVYAYCVRATPVYTDCTTEQSAVLDKLYNNFELQQGTNNIIVESSNGVGVNLELDCMQDLQAKLNLLEAMCVSNASQEV